MPDSPQSDDQFADLFSRLPAPASRATAPDGGSSAGGAGDTEPGAAPLSRRAAREASHSTPVPAPAPIPAQPAPTSTAPRSAQPLDALFGGAVVEDEHSSTARHKRDRRKSRIAGWVIFAVIIAILGGLTAGGFYVWNTYEDKIREIMGWEEPKDYEAGIAEGEATVVIVTGDTGSSISQTLFEAGVTKTDDAFYDYLIKSAQNPTFMPGVYQLQRKMTSAAALDALLDPANRQANTAQLREGLTVAQSLPLLVDGIGIPLEEFEAAVADPSVYGVSAATLEGWLFPATYNFDPGVTATDVIRTLVNRTVTSLDSAAVPVERREEILTIASIIQREARFEDDFYKVSRVIQNRLMPDNQETFGLLQMDSTAQYGYGEMHDGTVSSSAEALADDNPWNTYVHAGLPIGPIANPGDLAIDAAMHPADGPWLYFVTVNLETGETIFTETYAQHQKAIVQWQDWCAANPDSGC